MRSIKPNTRRRSLWRSVLLTLLAIVIGGAGTVATLAALKVIDPAKLAFWRSQETHPAGWISIPLSARPIPAYTEVTRDYLLNPKTGALELKWERRTDKVPKGVITDLSKIFGRVTAREKPAVYFFTESDFSAPGHPSRRGRRHAPGQAGVYLGRGETQGLRLRTERGRPRGLAGQHPRGYAGGEPISSGPLGASVMATPDTLLLPKRSLVKPLVQDGVVVSPVTVRMVPTTSSSLMNGTTTRNVRVQEIVLAVAPEEVAPLNEAMDLKYQMTCVARSGLPGTAAVHRRGRCRNLAGWNVSAPCRTGQGDSGQAERGLRRARFPPPERAKTVRPPKSERLPRTAWGSTSLPA